MTDKPVPAADLPHLQQNTTSAGDMPHLQQNDTSAGGLPHLQQNDTSAGGLPDPQPPTIVQYGNCTKESVSRYAAYST